LAAPATEPVRDIQANEHYQEHYLVGLLNYPNSAVPDILNGVTSGTLLGDAFGPYNYIPRYECVDF
jgi:hypothetical protein